MKSATKGGTFGNKATASKSASVLRSHPLTHRVPSGLLQVFVVLVMRPVQCWLFPSRKHVFQSDPNRHSRPECPVGCAACVNHDFCVKCEPGYALIGVSCVQRNLVTDQSECQVGMFIDAMTSECLSCAENCRSCSSFSHCTLCADGFYLSDGQCLPCSNKFPGCNLCEGYGSYCTNCSQWYHLDNGKCSGLFPFHILFRCVEESVFPNTDLQHVSKSIRTAP